MTVTASGTSGLSPRGRGNHRHGAGGHVCHGSIPAWAGKPRSAWAMCGRTTVYPRVGGETRLPTTGPMPAWGLSPRGRGNHRRHYRGRGIRGSIPAWAGKPSKLQCVTVPTAVYPRVGGETMMQCTVQSVTQGLSPRGRGNLGRQHVRMEYAGSIPAWAGKPTRWMRVPHHSAVYPRVGGETRSRGAFPGRLTGLSPRGRGNLKRVVVDPALQRSIPAWAGKPPEKSIRHHPQQVYPRVGGETR